MDKILERKIALACSVEHAFEVFTGKIDLWWPRGHRRNRDAALTLTPEALVERAPDGSQWTMGRVTAFEPHHHLALDWFPGSPNAPTSVDVRFEAGGGGAIISITHRALTPGAEAIWDERIGQFVKGWDSVLPALKSFIEED
ncbi:MAG: SRPBCC domain-containing protein [Devosia sp.]